MLQSLVTTDLSSLLCIFAAVLAEPCQEGCAQGAAEVQRSRRASTPTAGRPAGRWQCVYCSKFCTVQRHTQTVMRNASGDTDEDDEDDKILNSPPHPFIRIFGCLFIAAAACIAVVQLQGADVFSGGDLVVKARDLPSRQAPPAGAPQEAAMVLPMSAAAMEQKLAGAPEYWPGAPRTKKYEGPPTPPCRGYRCSRPLLRTDATSHSRPSHRSPCTAALRHRPPPPCPMYPWLAAPTSACPQDRQ